MSIYIDQKTKEVLARLLVLERRIEELESKGVKPFVPVDTNMDKRTREYKEMMSRVER